MSCNMHRLGTNIAPLRVEKVAGSTGSIRKMTSIKPTSYYRKCLKGYYHHLRERDVDRVGNLEAGENICIPRYNQCKKW